MQGVKFRQDSVRTSTIVMRSWSQTVRWITAQHAR
jgi:fructose-1,6-bisphosphatase II / sedoheptulose-1,7-bisphosphatase